MTEPNAELIPVFTPDEITCLLIMDDGAPLFGIGRWQKPCEVLAQRGFAKNEATGYDGSYYAITPSGRNAIKAYNEAEAAEFRRLSGRLGEESHAQMTAIAKPCEDE